MAKILRNFAVTPGVDLRAVVQVKRASKKGGQRGQSRPHPKCDRWQKPRSYQG